MSEALGKVLSGLPALVSFARAWSRGDDPNAELPPDEVIVVLEFSEPGFGFGEVTFVQTRSGCFLDTEYMSRERVKRMLCALVDAATADSDTDPAQHLRYNEVMGRTCGAGCSTCHPKEAP